MEVISDELEAQGRQGPPIDAGLAPEGPGLPSAAEGGFPAEGDGEIRARLAAIVESSDDAIISKTLRGTIRTWNAGAERIFGYTADEAIGRQVTMLIPPERLDEERQILARLTAGERIEHYETVRLAKGGRRLDVSLTVSPIRDSAGRIVGASKIARDVTEQKWAHEALMASEERFRALTEKLQEADRRKDDFVALLAHELRNPLAPLRNGLWVMRLAPDDAEAVAKSREMMERQLSHMVRLVDDLLDVSRINRNKMELRRTRMLLADVVASALETSRPAIEAAGHELTVTLPDEPVLLNADLTRMAQVFSNLLDNSAKYTQPGGHILLFARRKDDQVVVSVEDDGIGIAPAVLPNLFEIFSQADGSIERTNSGLGIGLALVKGLVEMHGGTVEASSPGLGLGSTFTVRLPAVQEQTPPSSEAAGEERRRSGLSPRRILVVDDNRDSAVSMAMMLRLLGNEVRLAHDGLEAVEAAEKFLPQIVLMDIGMPLLNGYEATRRIREQPWGREMKIVALTAWSGQEVDAAKSKMSGCDAHLVKPVNLTDLEGALAGLREAATAQEPAVLGSPHPAWP